MEGERRCSKGWRAAVETRTRASVCIHIRMCVCVLAVAVRLPFIVLELHSLSEESTSVQILSNLLPSVCVCRSMTVRRQRRGEERVGTNIRAPPTHERRVSRRGEGREAGSTRAHIQACDLAR